MGISIEVRSKVIALSQYTSKTQRQIAEACGISLGSVNNIIKLNRESGSVLPQRAEKCGRKRKTTKKEDMLLIRNSKINPTKTSDDLQKELAVSGTQVHASTVRRRLLEVGRKARKPIKKTAIDCSYEEEENGMGTKI